MSHLGLHSLSVMFGEIKNNVHSSGQGVHFIPVRCHNRCLCHAKVNVSLKVIGQEYIAPDTVCAVGRETKAK